MSRKISDELLIHAGQLVSQGGSLKDAAETVGCNPDVLSLHLRARGIKVVRRGGWIRRILPQETEDEIIRAYRLGKGAPSIAKSFNITREVVLRVLRRAGVPIRNIADANRIMAGMRTPEQKRQYIANARASRIQNLIDDANNGTLNHAIGPGEQTLTAILRKSELNPQQQVVIDGYIIDITVRDIAIEVKTHATSAHISKNSTARFEKIVEAGYKFVFVVTNSDRVLIDNAHYVVAFLNRIGRLQSSPGEYWVISCRLEQIGTHHKVDHFSVERRTPNPLQSSAD